jgi:hypothetical protein
MGSTRPRKENLASHCRIAAHGALSQQGGQRQEHGNAGAWAVLGNRARRHMNVDVGFFEQADIDA